jgi:tetratricopeptide (TPR) repeat protein
VPITRRTVIAPQYDPGSGAGAAGTAAGPFVRANVGPDGRDEEAVMPRWNPFGRSSSGDRPDDRPSPAAAAAAAEQLYAAGRYEPALAAYLDAAEHWQRVREQAPAELAPTVHAAGMLLGAGRCLGKLRRFEEAVQTLVGAESMAIELVAQDPARWRSSLAAVQEALAGAFGETGRWQEALTVSRRAVELRRAAGAEHDLAVALRVFAHVPAGTELPQALQAVAEATRLHLAVAAKLPDRAAYQSQIAMTQQVQALVVSRM